jgi:hypothetical protein
VRFYWTAWLTLWFIYLNNLFIASILLGLRLSWIAFSARRVLHYYWPSYQS